MVRIFEYAFECFESHSKCSSLHFNALNPFRMVRSCIQILWIWFEWFEFAFECFESFWMLWIFSNG